jgi:hypothetical protein
VAIQTATKLVGPLDSKHLNDALEQVRSSRARSKEDDFETILGLHKDLAEIYWLERVKAILEGKLANKTNEYSYEGIVYSVESANKGPISSQQRATFKEIAEAVREAE